MPPKSLVAPLFRLADGIFRRADAGMQAVHQGFWLGWMGSKSLNEATRLYYQGVPKYLESEYNTSGLKAWEAEVLDRFFGECRTLLVGAAGGGREVVALARKGLEVMAFECSAEMVEAARDLLAEAALVAEVLDSKPGEVPRLETLSDGVIVGWGGYMHIPGRAARIRFLEELRERVHPGGPLLLSFFTRSSDSRLFSWIQRLARVIRRLRFSREEVELGDALAGSFDHHFTKEEIASELAAAGFQLVEYQEDPVGHAVGMATRAPLRTAPPRWSHGPRRARRSG
jgi:SAM-dependent methyltransferase